MLGIEGGRFNLVPVDYVADAMDHIAHKKGLDGGCFHLTDPEAYREACMVGDIERVMDATGTKTAVLVGLCGDGVWRGIQLAAARPERVLGIVAFAPGVPKLSPPHPWRVQYSFEDELPTDERAWSATGWASAGCGWG